MTLSPVTSGKSECNMVQWHGVSEVRSFIVWLTLNDSLDCWTGYFLEYTSDVE